VETTWDVSLDKKLRRIVMFFSLDTFGNSFTINVHMHILIRKIRFSNQIDTMLCWKNNYNLLNVTNKTKFKTNLWKLKAMVS